MRAKAELEEGEMDAEDEIEASDSEDSEEEAEEEEAPEPRAGDSEPHSPKAPIQDPCTSTARDVRD